MREGLTGGPVPLFYHPVNLASSTPVDSILTQGTLCLGWTGMANEADGHSTNIKLFHKNFSAQIEVQIMQMISLFG